MKNVIKPIFLSTLLSVVGYSEAQIINDTYAADVTSAPVESLSVTIANSEVSIIESNTIEVGYDIDNITQSKYSIEVISYDEDIISASVNDDNIVIQAGTVDFETTVNVDVVVTSEFGTSLVSMPITVLQQPNLDLVVEDTEVSMEFLDQLYIPFTVSHDGEEELTLSIEDIEGVEFAEVELESTDSASNNLIIQGNGVYQTGTLTFNLVATSDNEETTVPVTVNVYPDVDIDITLSNEAPTFNETDSAFTIVRVCSEQSDDYEIEISQVSGNEAIEATVEGSVISITSDNISEDTTASFMVTASILGVSEEAYFDVYVSAE